MAAFTAKDVQALREKTGVGMMDCKKALVESDGDMEKAIDFLREKGLAAATKKAGRIAAEGVVLAYNNEEKKIGVVVEVNSETDFVAKNQEFQSFVLDIAKTIAASNPPMWMHFWRKSSRAASAPCRRTCRIRSLPSARI